MEQPTIEQPTTIITVDDLYREIGQQLVRANKLDQLLAQSYQRIALLEETLAILTNSNGQINSPEEGKVVSLAPSKPK